MSSGAAGGAVVVAEDEEFKLAKLTASKHLESKTSSGV